MRYAKYSNVPSRHQNRCAAVFVDFDNLFSLLTERLEDRSYPDAVITEAIDELRRYLIEELRTPTHLTNAYADFSALSGNGSFIQRSLILQDVDPRFTAGAVQDNAAEVQLCTELMEVLHRREDITTFAVMTGDRLYLPLMQHLKHSGRTVLLVTLDPPSSEALSYLGEEAFVDLCNLLSEPTQRLLLGEGAARNGSVGREPREGIEYLAITDLAARRTLEIIEEYFGQYEEVYLTPLLRKLSELLDDDEHDPKTIINDLEAAGAVWLEKRRGFPYDYTVLLVDTDHPDVREIQQAFYERQEAESDDAYYEEEPYDAYDDYAEEDYDTYAEDEYTEDDLDEDLDDVEDYEDEEPFEEDEPVSYDDEHEAPEAEEADRR